MKNLAKALLQEADIASLAARLEGGTLPALISGLSGVHRAHTAAAIRAQTGRPVTVICADELEAARLTADLTCLAGEAVTLLSTRDFTFYNAEGVSRAYEQRRIGALYAMLYGAGLTVAPVSALLQRALPPERLRAAVMQLGNGGHVPPEQVADALARAGYSRCEQVEGPGQYALRGGILDFFSPAGDEPVRCEFFGDEIDSLCTFNAGTQRRGDQIDEALILPAAETLIPLYSGGRGGAEGLAGALREMGERLSKKRGTPPALIKNIEADAERLENRRVFPAADKYMQLIYPFACGTDYISPDSIVLLCEPIKCAERAKNFVWQLGEDTAALLEAGALEPSLARFCDSWNNLLSRLEEFPTVMLDSFTAGQYPLTPRSLGAVSAKQLPSYGGSMETAAGDIAHYAKSGYRTVILSRDERRGALLEEYLRGYGIPVACDFSLSSLPDIGKCLIAVGTLSGGMEYPVSKLAVITEGQMTSQASLKRKRSKKPTNRERIQSFTDLAPGDLVVHEHHGIGRYAGFYKMPVDGVTKDYVKISYAGSDALYVPATQLDLVSKYIGGGEDAGVRLSKMGGADWTRVKTRAKAAAKDLARELIALYAQRSREKGHAFAPDSVWQTEFEARFEYQETEDQLRCIEEIKADMERSLPMDRLLCGDVGYGKTEVALRSVMKCVLDGRQAAILVPTTVLAQQHYVTASRRFAGYPVNIEVMSRFRTPAQLKKSTAALASGGIDLVIGTHRLLQKDVKFKKLGLIIVDEEQRFGVGHKERLKELSRQVDVLTLSATPIPRTLNMALSGIRDLSTIDEPPQDRQPVQTFVLEHDWGIVTDAIRREVSRGGQVYYLHNRIENIERTAARLREMLGDVTVGAAHGRMDEETLSDVMERMSGGEVQVLVCTTIIETGIDIPNVNTLIIEDADKLGLAQLHQIRGRVGRSPRRAYAYLTFRPGRSLTEIAQKRLEAIREFAQFGSGIKIAMRDLEIRGAGNLLGAEQSGHMVSVGYDMYLKLLEEAVLEERGEKPKAHTECSADLQVTAYIPERYVPSGEQRMDLYRRIARIRTEEDADEMIAELIDRYGDPPGETVALVSVALMRGEAARAGVAEISQKSGYLKFRLDAFDLSRVSLLYSREEYKGRLRVEAGAAPVISLKLRGRALDEAVRFVRDYAAAASEAAPAEAPEK